MARGPLVISYVLTDKQANFNAESKKSQGTMEQEIGADGDNKVFPVTEPSLNQPAITKHITERFEGAETSVDTELGKFDRTDSSDNPSANMLDLHTFDYQEPTNMNESETEEQMFDTSEAAQVSLEEVCVSSENSKLSPGITSLERSHIDTESSVSPENQVHSHSDNTRLVAGKTEALSNTNSGLLVKHFQSVTLNIPVVSHSSSINPDDGNTFVPDDKDIESESEEVTSSNDESIPEKPVTQVAQTEILNGKKRKKKTSKRAYRKKRERKRGKKEENKGADKADNVQISVVFSEVKHRNTAKKDNEIKPHALTEASAMKQDTRSENRDKLNPNKDLVLSLSATPSAENISTVNHQNNNGSGVKIFGSLKDCDKSGTNNLEFEARGPPSNSSLFRLDGKAKDTVETKENTSGTSTKEGKDTSSQEAQTKMENKNVQPDGANGEGRSVTNENQDQTRVTRSQKQAKNKQTRPDQTNKVKTRNQTK